MKKLNKKQKIVSAMCIFVIAGGGLFAYGKHNSSVKIAEAKETLQLSSKEVDSLNKKINELYDTEDSNFLKESINESEITQLEKEVTKETNFNKESLLKKSDYADYDKKVSALKEKMNTTKIKYETLITVNSLFKQDESNSAINGSDVNTELPIVDDLSSESVEEAKNKYFTEGATSTYDKSINDLLTNAESQLTQIKLAKEAVEQVYKDGIVISIDNDLYNNAKNLAEQIKNEKAKNELVDQLNVVKADIDKKAAEQQAATQSAAQETTATESNNASNSTATGANNNYAGNGSNNNYAGNGSGATNNAGSGAASSSPNQGSGNNASASTGNGNGVMSQDDLNKAAEDASNSDPTKDPNSPWYNK